MNALHTAAKQGREGVVRMLLDAGGGVLDYPQAG